jgi:N-acetylmuramoyl-L-alanine amidase
LVDNAIGEFLARHLHFATAKALQVGQRRVRPDLDALLLREPNGPAHVVEVGGVEAAGDVGHRNQRHQRFIVSHPVEAEGLTHIAIDRRHALLPGS